MFELVRAQAHDRQLNGIHLMDRAIEEWLQ